MEPQLQTPVQTQENPKKMSKVTKVILIIVIVVFCIIGLCSLVLTMIISSLTPKDITRKETSQVSEIILDYLNNKYGDQDFKIKYLEASNSYNGFVYSGRNGYDAGLSSKDVGYFRVYTRGEMASTTKVSYDGFAEGYYDTQTPDTFERSLGIDKYTFGIDGTKVPEHFGRIPTIGELWNFGAIESYIIQLYESGCAVEDGDEVEPTECIKNATEQMIAHYGITEDFKFYLTFTLEDGSRFDVAYVEVVGQKIYLKKGDAVIYTLDR